MRVRLIHIQLVDFKYSWTTYVDHCYIKNFLYTSLKIPLYEGTVCISVKIGKCSNILLKQCIFNSSWIQFYLHRIFTNLQLFPDLLLLRHIAALYEVNLDDLFLLNHLRHLNAITCIYMTHLCLFFKYQDLTRLHIMEFSYN